MHQVIEIADNGRYLSKYRGFLRVSVKEYTLADIPLEDIAAVIISAEDTLLSKNIIVELANHGVPIIYCGRNYVPQSISLPIYQHYLAHERLAQQIAASATLKGQCWQAIVKAKIHHQAALLSLTNSPGVKRLQRIAGSVKVNDSENAEAQAALVYWKCLMGHNFRRDRKADNHNILLNYGYAVLRAATARALAACGLNLTLGLFHKNKHNAMCLVDDLMEPFRPLVDRHVKHLLDDDNAELTPANKQQLISILIEDLTLDNLPKGMIHETAFNADEQRPKTQNSPLTQCLLKSAQSLVKSYETNSNELRIARWQP